MAHPATALLAQTDQTPSNISEQYLKSPWLYHQIMTELSSQLWPLRTQLDCLNEPYPFKGKPLQMINQAHCHAILSSVWLFETPWTVAHQAPLSMEFSRQEHWRVGCHTLLQGIFLTQGLTLCLLHWQADSLPLSPSPWILSISCKIKSLENKA